MSPPSFFSRLLGTSEPSAEPSTQPASSPPAKAATAAGSTQNPPLTASAEDSNAFVRREAILDRKERVSGYEFSLRMAENSPLQRRSGTARRAYDSALLARLGDLSSDSLLGQRQAALRISPDSLRMPELDSLPGANTLLILDGTPRGNDWAGTAERVAQLREKGFVFGLHIAQADDAHCPLIGALDYLQFSICAFDGFDLQGLIKALPKEVLAGKTKLIAADVHSHDDFLFCVKCSFDLFQGPFVTHHDSWRPSRGGINRSVAMPVLAMIRSDENFGVIADQLKLEPTLTYKLLRYLNSPAVGLRQKIDNLTHALVVIGRDKFYRWMSLLLFHFERAGYRERMLTEQALVRGRTLELLAGKGKIPPAPEHLFLIGLFSLLDIVMGQPLPELLKSAAVPDSVRDALLGNKGVLADALHLAMLGEADSMAAPAQYEAALHRCGLSDADFAPAATQALVWVHEIVESGET